MSAPAGIEFRDVQVHFRHADGRRIAALQDINLAIPKGQFVCIVGRSGGGKSTLVRALAGLILPTAGRVSVDGTTVTGPSAGLGAWHRTRECHARDTRSGAR